MKRGQDQLERKLRQLYSQVPPPPGNLMAGRERMLREAANMRLSSSSLSKDKAHKPTRRRKMKLALVYKLVAAIIAMVVGTTAMGGGVVMAAGNSLPGDILYPVKLGVEDVRMAVTADPAARAELALEFTAERTAEVERLLERGDVIPEQVIRRMARQTDMAMEQIALSGGNEAPQLLERAMEQAQTQQQVLERAKDKAAEEAQPALQLALQATRRAYQTLSAAHGDPRRFQEEYNHRYRGTPTPQVTPEPTHKTPGPTHTPKGGKATRTPEAHHTPTPGPKHTPKGEEEKPHTPHPTATMQEKEGHGQDKDKGATATPQEHGQPTVTPTAGGHHEDDNPTRPHRSTRPHKPTNTHQPDHDNNGEGKP